MGVTYQDAVMYLRAKRRGATFEQTLTLGHQALYLHRSEAKSLCKQYEQATGTRPSSIVDYRWGEYADAFFGECLGVNDLTVMDASEYEGADTIHDMNQPIPDAFKGRFDIVIDCGSLEHIFNVPVALQNLAEMLKVGGTLFITTPANNLMGHGFYQFSPELMFRVFSAENGFQIQDLTLFEGSFPSVELTRNHKLFKVSDPQQVHSRVGLQSKRPAMMMVEAVKLSNERLFATPPFQSDYVSAWARVGESKPSAFPHRKLARAALNALPRGLRAQLLGIRQRRSFSLRNSRFYSRQRLPR